MHAPVLHPHDCMLPPQALLESSARSKELGPITLNLNFCDPFWKLLLGQPLSLMDLQSLDATEFRSLMQLMNFDIDGLVFENFAWSFHHPPGMNTADPDTPNASGE
jgi:HECT-domain (ubiquitin-transferase)